MGMYYPDSWSEAKMRKSTEIDCSGDSPVTKQEFAKDCDVNLIVARCLRGGVELPGADIQGVFADVSALPNFAEMQNRIRSAEEAFMELPADVRLEFNNDPARLIAFIQDDRNYDRAVSLGLVVKPALPAVVPPKAAVEPVAPVVPPK